MATPFTTSSASPSGKEMAGGRLRAKVRDPRRAEERLHGLRVSKWTRIGVKKKRVWSWVYEKKKEVWGSSSVNTGDAAAMIAGAM